MLSMDALMYAMNAVDAQMYAMYAHGRPDVRDVEEKTFLERFSFHKINLFPKLTNDRF